MIQLEVEGKIFPLECEENATVIALQRYLQKSPITIEMHDFAHLEKCGSLPVKLPICKSCLKVTQGDLVLCTEDQMALYYGENCWYFTKLGHVKNTHSNTFQSLLTKDSFQLTISAREETEENKDDSE